MRVLVTGTTGFVGKNLVTQLSTNRNFEITASETTPGQSTPSVKFIPLDITDEAATLAMRIDRLKIK